MKILLDIGGTNMRIAGSADGETIGTPVKFESIPNYAEGLEALAQHARDIAAGQPIEAIGIGFKAIISADKRMPLNAPQGFLEDWKNKPLAADLEARLGGRCIIENDSAIVGLGEAVFGAGKGARIVEYITVSTGVGGARFVDGKLDVAAQGFEMGHQYLGMGDGAPTLENLISGTAITKRFGKKPKEIAKDDPVWEELAVILAYGVYNSILMWSPHRVVIGGSMMNEIGIPVDRVAFHLARINTIYPTVPEVVHSALGDDGGLWGALALVR